MVLCQTIDRLVVKLQEVQQRSSRGKTLDLNISINSLFTLEFMVTPLSYKFMMENMSIYNGNNDHLEHMENFK